jgi:hypothetical protein
MNLPSSSSILETQKSIKSQSKTQEISIMAEEEALGAFKEEGESLVSRFFTLLVGVASWILILASPFGFLVLFVLVFIWKTFVFWWLEVFNSSNDDQVNNLI